MGKTAIQKTTPDLEDLAKLFDEGSGTVSDTCEKFGIGRTVLYQWMQDGKLPFSKASGRRLIPWSIVKRLLATELVGTVNIETTAAK